MSISEKTLHRYNLLMEIMKDVHGDAERTSGELENSMKGLTSRVRNISEEFGAKLYPAVNKVVNILNSALDKFSALDEETKDQILKFAGLTTTVLATAVGLGLFVTAIGTAVKGLGMIGSLFTSLLPILLIGAGVAAVGGLVYTAWNENWAGISGAFIEAFSSIKEWWDSSHLKESLTNGIAALKEIWTDPSLSLGEKVVETLEVAVGVLKAVAWDAFEFAKNVIIPVLPVAIDKLKATAVKAFEIVGDHADLFKTGLSIKAGIELSGMAGALLKTQLNKVFASMGGKMGDLSGGAAMFAVLTVGVALAEAAGEKGSWEDVGRNIATSLALGLGVGALLKSPQAGVLTFTLAMNLELGEKLFGWTKTELEQFKDQNRSTLIQGSAGQDIMPDVQRLENVLATYNKALNLSKNKNFDELKRVLESYFGYTVSNTTTPFIALQTQAEAAANTVLGLQKVLDANTQHEIVIKVNTIINDYISTSFGVGAPLKFHDGGLLPGTSGPDKFPALLAPGEAVVPASAVRGGIGGVADWFKKMNVPGFKTGKAPSITGNANADIASVDSFISGITEMVSKVTTILTKAFEFIGKFIIKLAEKIFGEDKVADLLKAFEEFKNLFKGDGAGNSTNTAVPPAAVETTNDTAQQFKDALQYLKNDLMSTVIGAAPIASDAINAGAQGMQVAGPMGALAGVLVSLISKSETFSQIMDIINPILQVAADMFGMIIQPILPLVQVLESVLVPVFNALGTILASLLEPAFKMLFPVIKFLGEALLFIVEVFQNARAFILDAIAGLVTGLGNFLNDIWGGWGDDLLAAGRSLEQSADDARASAQDLADSRKELSELTYEGAMAQATQNEELKKASESIRNAPTGFKVAIARFNAAQGAALATQMQAASRTMSSATNRSQNTGDSGRDITINVNRPVYGVSDFKNLVKETMNEYFKVNKVSIRGV